MKRSKYTDEQILAIVKEGEAGRKVADLCRTHGITEQTYYRWKAKYCGMELSEVQAAQTDRGREPTAETDRRRADARHPGGRRKKVVGPIDRREAVGWLQTRGTSLRRACRVPPAAHPARARGRVGESQAYPPHLQGGGAAGPAPAAEAAHACGAHAAARRKPAARAVVDGLYDRHAGRRSELSVIM